MRLSIHSTVVASKQQVSVDLQGDVVILELASGVYYGLQQVGSDIWKQLAEPVTVGAICAALLEEYAIEPERCEQETLAFLCELAAFGLIEIVPEPVVNRPKGSNFNGTLLHQRKGAKDAEAVD